MATRVKDGIFVADGESSQDPEFIELNKIGYIVNCAGRQLPNLWSAHGVRYLTFTWDDDPNYTLFDTQDARCCVVVEQIVAFVDEALCAGESVLLHSFLGTGRCVACCIAYFMAKYEWGLDKTCAFVKSKRGDANPNAGFLKQLRLLDKRLQVARSRLMAKLPPRERHDALEAARRRLVDWDARVPRLAARFEADDEDAEDLVDDEPLLVNSFFNGQVRVDVGALRSAAHEMAHVSTKLRWVDGASNGDNGRLISGPGGSNPGGAAGPRAPKSILKKPRAPPQPAPAHGVHFGLREDATTSVGVSNYSHGTGFESVDSTAESLLLQQLDRSHALERSMAPERRLRELVRDVELGSPRRPPPQGHRDSLFLAKYRRDGGAAAADDAELPAVAWDAQASGQAPGGAPPGNQARPQSAPVSRDRDAGAAPFGSGPPGRAGAQPSRKPRPGTPAAQARGGAPATPGRGPRPQGPRQQRAAAPPPQDRPLYYGAASLSMRTGRSPGGGGRPGSSGDRRHVHADFPDPFPANRVVYGGPQPRRGGADRPSSAPTRRTPAGAPKGALPKQLNAKHGRDASIEELMIRGATSSARGAGDDRRAREPKGRRAPRAGPDPLAESRRPPRHAPDPLAGDRWAQPTRVYAPKRTTKPKRDRADVPHRARPQY